MSDERQWQPPASGANAVGGTTPYGSQTAGGSNAGSDAGQQQPVGWTSPPKPGLIPLRPLTLGNILGSSFQVLRRNPRPTFGLALLVEAAITLVSLLLVGFVAFAAISRIEDATFEDSQDIAIGAISLGIVSTLVPVILGSIAVALLQGIVVLEVQRAALGEKQKLRQLWSRARGRLGALVGWTMLVGAIVLVAIIIIGVVVTIFIATLGVVGIVLGVLIGIFGIIAFIVLAAWLGTKLSLVPSALMAERGTLRESIARSWSLTGGYFWKTFGIQLLVAFILGVVTQLVYTPVSLIGSMLSFLVDPNDTNSSTVVTVIVGTYIVSIIVMVVFSAISLVVQSASTTLIYIDIRMRKEGLDLELARYVEQTIAGTSGLADPYLLHVQPSHTMQQGPSPYGPMRATNESPWQ